MFVEVLIAITSTFLLTLLINTLGKRSILLLPHPMNSHSLGQVRLEGGRT